MKIITTKFDSASRLKCYLFHADPDELIRLHEGAGHLDEAEASRRFNLVLHDTRLGGVWKRTGHNRLGGTLGLIDAHLDAVWPAGERRDLQVLDVGASDGTSTLELCEHLRPRGFDRLVIWLTDKYLWLHRFQRGPIVEYRAFDGQPSLARVGRVGLRLPRSEHRWHWAANLLGGWYLRLDRFRASMRATHKIELVNPRVAQYPEIRPRELDCLVEDPELVGKMDVVRLSNVLNPSYFDADEIARCLRTMHAYLRDDGCLVVSRNLIHGATEHEQGSLWRRTPSGFAHQADFGGGSEVRPLVDAVALE